MIPSIRICNVCLYSFHKVIIFYSILLQMSRNYNLHFILYFSCECELQLEISPFFRNSFLYFKYGTGD